MEQSVSYIHGSVQRYPPADIPAFQSWLPVTILYPKRRFPVPFQHPKSRFSAPIAFRYHPGTPTIAFWFHSGNHSSTQASLSGTPPAPLAFRYHSGIRTITFRYPSGTTSLGWWSKAIAEKEVLTDPHMRTRPMLFSVQSQPDTLFPNLKRP